MATDDATDRRSRVGSQEVGLGCGSLLLIALIVWFVPNSTAKELRGDVQQLEQRLQHVERKLDELIRLVERR